MFFRRQPALSSKMRDYTLRIPSHGPDPRAYLHEAVLAHRTVNGPMSPMRVAFDLGVTAADVRDTARRNLLD